MRLESLEQVWYQVLKVSSTLPNFGVENSYMLPVSDVTIRSTCAPVRLDNSLACQAPKWLFDQPLHTRNDAYYY